MSPKASPLKQCKSSRPTIAVSDAQARVAVASLVRKTRAAAEVGAIADFPAAEHDRDIARPENCLVLFSLIIPGLAVGRIPDPLR